jgi:hypothetical protein
MARRTFMMILFCLGALVAPSAVAEESPSELIRKLLSAPPPPPGYRWKIEFKIEVETSNRPAIARARTILDANEFVTRLTSTTGDELPQPLLKLVGTRDYLIAAPTVDTLCDDLKRATVGTATVGTASKFTWSVSQQPVPMAR